MRAIAHELSAAKIGMPTPAMNVTVSGGLSAPETSGVFAGGGARSA